MLDAYAISTIASTIKHYPFTRPLIEAGLEYMRRDYHVIAMHSVYGDSRTGEIRCTCGQDCGQPGKHPRGKWKGRRLTVNRLVNLFAERPLSGLSLGTGAASGFFVVDIDGAAGAASLATLEAAHGRLSSTVTTLSGSQSGSHRWFNMPPGLSVPNSASTIGAHIDIRGDGGLIIVPPSPHKSGGSYRFAPGLALGEVEIADAREGLLDFVCKDTTRREPTNSKRTRARQKPAGSDCVPTEGKCSHEHENGTIEHLRGVEGILAELGDGDGQKGFDGPIWRALLSYFCRDSERDATAILERVREAVAAAYCEPAREARRARYLSDAYLHQQIENARVWIRSHADDRPLKAPRRFDRRKPRAAAGMLSLTVADILPQAHRRSGGYK